MRLFGRDPADGHASLDGVAGFVESPTFYPYLSGRENLELLGRSMVASNAGGSTSASTASSCSIGHVTVWVATRSGCGSDSGSRRR